MNFKLMKTCFGPRKMVFQIRQTSSHQWEPRINLTQDVTDSNLALLNYWFARTSANCFSLKKLCKDQQISTKGTNLKRNKDFDYFNKYSWLFWRHVNFNLSIILLIYMLEIRKKYSISLLKCSILSISSRACFNISLISVWKWELESEFRSNLL